MSDLVISIVNHNSVDPLRNCLQSVLASCDITESAGIAPCDIFVVDNLCENRAHDMIVKEFPHVNIIVNSRVLGFGANHNQVLERNLNNSKFVLVLNPDTILLPGAMAHMLEFMDSHEKVAICGPRLHDAQGVAKEPIRKALFLRRDAILLGLYVLGISSRVFGQILLLSRWLRRRPSAETTEPESITSAQEPMALFCEGVDGACMLIRSEMLRKVGLFDERFFLYYEETDLCLRAIQNGWQIAFLPGAEVFHSGGYSTKPQYHANLTIFARSCLAFYHKHQGSRAVWVLRIQVFGAAIANLIRWTVYYAVLPSRRREAAAWLAFSKSLLKVACQPI